MSLSRRICEVDGCSGTIVGREMCGKHWRRWRVKARPEELNRRGDWTRTPNAKAALNEAVTAEGFVERRNEAIRSAHNRLEVKARDVEVLKRSRQNRTPEQEADYRARIAASVKAHWDTLTPEQRSERNANWVRAAREAVWPGMVSSIERTVQGLLDALGVVYEAQAEIGPFWVDILVPDKKLVIECDGEYWHNLPGVPERDSRRDTYLRNRGYTVVRLPERDINTGAYLRPLAEAIA